MNQKAKLVKPTRNVGACEGGADCGDGWCCYDTDYPVCCPDTSYYTNWCAVTFDDCPASNKQLPKMAAEKKQRRLNMDLKTIAKNKESMKAAVARIQVQQDDCTEDCGYEIIGTGLVCAAYYSDEDDWINCMITYTSVDCSACLCEILEESEGYTCSFTDKKKMNQKAKLVKPTRNVGACEGGADCGDGWCCYNPDYPVCCPDTDYFTNWCGATADDCPTSLKKLPKMAADKNARQVKRSYRKECAGTNCGDGTCCDDAGYSVCCPVCDDGSLWCADTADDCGCNAKRLPPMAANKKIQKPTKQMGDGCDGTDCGNNWCCNDSDYSVCCPIGDDGIQWCANDADDCPSTRRF